MIKNAKFVYPLLIILTTCINSFCCVIFTQNMLCHVVPLVVFALQITLLMKLSFYTPTSKYKLLSFYLFGIAVQILLLIKQLQFPKSSIGSQDNDFGIYLVFSILFLLIVLEIIMITFFVYSIKRFRCCELEI